MGKCFYFLSFAILFAGLRAALCTEKMIAISSQMGKVQNGRLFGLFVLATLASSWCWRRHRWVVARAQQSVCASAQMKASALQGNFPTTYLFVVPRGPLL